MEITIQDKIKLYNAAVEDSVITAVEKAELEKVGIREELLAKLSGKTEEDMVDVLQKTFSSELDTEEKSTEKLSLWGKAWNVTNKIIGGVLGGVVGRGLISKFTMATKYIRFGGILGALAGIALSTLTNIKPKTNDIINTTKTSDNFFETLEECEYIIKSGDNLRKIASEHETSTAVLLEANPQITNANLISIGDTITIPKRRKIKQGSLVCINDVATATQVSMDYINDIILGFECQNKKPALKAYYDKVKDEDYPNGRLTIGFGHTGKVRGKKITENTEITKEEAYEILTQDLLNAKNAVIRYLGKENFEKAPVSIQSALIDIAFNKGIDMGFKGIKTDEDGKTTRFNTPTQGLKKDIENQDYISSIEHVIYGTKSLGLKRRNVYRIIMATKDLSELDRKNALKRTENYYLKVKKELSKEYPVDAKMLESTWDKAYNEGICTGF